MSQPPAYNANGLSEDPPAYQPLTNLRVGAHRLESPLVQTKHLKLHLALLHAFSELRSAVEGQTGAATAYFPREVQQLSAERRWTWFVHLAVERFDRWTRSLPHTVSQGIDSGLWDVNNAPPLDVWMVWHAYLLNPRCYAEDTQRVSRLATLGALHIHSSSAFFSALEQLGHLTNLSQNVSIARKENWQQRIGLPFDPIKSSSVLVTQMLQCPNCGRVYEALYITPDGTGFAQQHFVLRCAHDGHIITREGLAVARFSQDLARDHAQAEKSGDPTPFLANTLRTPKKDIDLARAKVIKDIFLSALPIVRKRLVKINFDDSSGLSRAIADEFGWRWSKLQATPTYRARTRLMSRVLMAYNDQRPFSVELVGAVLRQGSFVAKMVDLGWTKPGYFSTPEDERALHHASARYHAFLDLMASSPDAFFVPTLDIDLAWHTHQLSASTYNSDCLRLIGRFVDHDDKVEEMHLSDAFDVTCRAWNARFGVEYMHCGCPLPGATIGQRLSRLIHHASHAHSGSVLESTAPVATHPSDHNGVYVPGATTDAALSEHSARLAKRRQRDLKKVHKGKMDRDIYTRGDAHGAAFLYPVPLWYGMAGCAAGAGLVCDGGYSGCSATSGAACAGGGLSCGGSAGAAGCAGSTGGGTFGGGSACSGGGGFSGGGGCGGGGGGGSGGGGGCGGGGGGGTSC